MIYLDNAATSWPKPEVVYRTMDRFLREKGGNPGHGSHSLAEAAKQTVDETRLLVARFIKAPEVERVVFTLNCTDSINMGLKGLLKPGDHVITSSLEHNAVMRPLNRLTERGIKITKIPVLPDMGVTSPEDVEKAIVPETRLIVMIHASNVNGALQPIEEYGAISRKRGLMFMVDAAQSVGHLPLDVLTANVDLLAFSAHKAPLGPPGVGVLYMSPRVALDTLREGGTGLFSESEKQPDCMPNKFESGTVNSVGISGLGAGLKFIISETMDRISSHEQSMMKVLLDGLSQIQRLKLFTSRNIEKQAPVVSFNIDGYEPGEVGTILDQAFDIKTRSGLHCSPEAHRSLGSFPLGTVRLSPGYFNTEQQMKETIEAINKIARAKK